MKKSLELIPDNVKLNYCLAVETISKHSGIKKRELLKSPAHSLAMYRFMIFALMEEIGTSNLDSGSLIGKDHATVSHGLKEHANLYEQNYKGYKTLFDTSRQDFLGRVQIDDLSNQDPQNRSFYELIREIEVLQSSIKKIKNVLIESYLEGFDLKEEVSEIIKSALPKSA